MSILDIADVVVADLNTDAIGLDTARVALALATVEILKRKAPDRDAYVAAVVATIALLTRSKERKSE